MRGRPLQIAWRAGDEEPRLRQLYRAERHPAVRTRLQLLWRLRAGDRVTEAAAHVGVSERAAHGWLARYRRGGLGSLRAAPGRGRGRRFASKLTAAQWEQVRDHLRAGTTRTAAQLARWIAATFDVRYTAPGLCRALRRHRLRVKVPRPRHAKADRAAQAAGKGGASGRP